jgi:hypothetical protein
MLGQEGEGRATNGSVQIDRTYEHSSLQTVFASCNHDSTSGSMRADCAYQDCGRCDTSPPVPRIDDLVHLSTRHDPESCCVERERPGGNRKEPLS